MVEGVSGARQEGNKFGIKVLKCESDKNKEGFLEEMAFELSFESRDLLASRWEE